MPEFDEVMESNDQDWSTKSLKGVQVFLKASNQTDQNEFLEKTRKVKFGSGWTEVWSKCGGFANRINK